MNSLDAGAHVIVEKPAAPAFEQLETLVRRARQAGRHFIEDYNYVFNRAPQEILRRIESGEFGAVTHVEVLICLDILGPGGFADPNSPHPALTLAGGAIADFLPHSGVAGVPLRWSAPDRPDGLDQAQVLGPAIRRVPRRVGCGAWDCGSWLQLQLAAGRILAAGLRGANAGQPPTCSRHGSPSTGPATCLSRCAPSSAAWRKGRPSGAPRLATLLRKFKGPGAYEGLWELLDRTYLALADGSALPVTASQVLEVNRMVEALKPKEQRP